MTSTDAAAWASAIGELAIAGVIYYELEVNRAASAMANILDEPFTKDRRELYNAYVAIMPLGASIKERAEAFQKKLHEDPGLRSMCDDQWTKIARLQYALSWSPHRNLLARWFPHVLVSLWAMTGPYVRERQKLRPSPLHKVGPAAVKASLRVILSQAHSNTVQPIHIYGPNDSVVEIPASAIKAMHRDLDAPFQ